MNKSFFVSRIRPWRSACGRRKDAKEDARSVETLRLPQRLSTTLETKTQSYSKTPIRLRNNNQSKYQLLIFLLPTSQKR
ncbi:hypothetical protein ACQFX9_11495 [Aliinostoc sp. HNIBRCY26]|uniref:hypothetical protein n=1 Tax=Aliinostoc sp. HNIBRCY26 TaxID=3418997 RepID=UPI003CFDAA42